MTFSTWSDSAWAALSGNLMAVLRVLVILGTAWVATGVAQRAIRALRIRIATRFDDPEAVRRAETLGRAFRYVAAVAIWLLAALLVLSEFGVSLAPLLGAAGVAGVALGFGAQALVKDYLAGVFLLLENQLRQGDVVKLGEHSGVVEDLTLRYVQLRDYDGHVHFVPNGTISAVVNLSRGHAQAVVDVGVAYNADLPSAMKVMRDTAANMCADPEFTGRILDSFELAGVERWDDSAVVIRGRFRVAPLEQWGVRRAYLLRLKQAFDEAGIEIPYPHLTVQLDRPAVRTAER